MMVEVLVVLVLPVGGVSQGGAVAAFFIVTIAAGAGKSYLEATCYAMAGTMPPRFMSAVMFGCGFSGVVSSTLQCIIKASMEDSYDSVLKQAYIYFSLALGIMATSTVLAVCLRFNRYAQKYVGEFRKIAKERGQEEEGEDSFQDDCPPEDREPAAITEGDVVLEGDTVSIKKLTEDDEDNEVRVVRSELEEEEDDKHLSTSEQLQKTRMWPIIKLIYPVQIACFNIFFVSLFIFPSLILPIDRKDKWFGTIAILLYNCGDATGRLSSSLKFLWPPRWVLLMVSFIRFIYICLIFLCIYGYIPGHAPAYVIIATLGLTKGFFGATSMVFGPNTPGLKTEGQRVMAGQLMGISLLAGASVSALLALVVVLRLPEQFQ
ncbi:solute carrier family 29 (equilibrative nucleoside transporter), member 1/2/3 [Angomonas deanei]|nr:solute carrier family 29 (equilibrative nucleoside transporter), member 1/2/3 [Angomonas deanei]|eukprot:EPY27157.1 solute carrier family 29 (equilibrative nucleoside transporter), member 1/2/3 [Angomonas deanei]